MSDILQRIVAVKREEIAAARAQRSRPLRCAERRPARDAARLRARDARQARAGAAAVIAEIKKASPSKGVLRADFVPADIAASYADGDGGAACLSVLTDEQFFQGSADYLQQARASLHAAGAAQGLHGRPLPGVRGARHGRRLHPADRRLPGRCADGRPGSHRAALGMAVLVEVHDGAELDRALKLKTPLLGINNRNLRTFEVTLDTTLGMLPTCPRPPAGHRVRHPEACRRQNHARRRRARLPGGRGLHARPRAGAGAGQAVCFRACGHWS
jgi:indole-3-glycerol phosphate synthase